MRKAVKLGLAVVVVFAAGASAYTSPQQLAVTNMAVLNSGAVQPVARDAMVRSLQILERTLPPTLVRLVHSGTGAGIGWHIVQAGPPAVAQALQAHSQAGLIYPSEALVSALSVAAGGLHASSAYAGGVDPYAAFGGTNSYAAANHYVDPYAASANHYGGVSHELTGSPHYGSSYDYNNGYPGSSYVQKSKIAGTGTGLKTTATGVQDYTYSGASGTKAGAISFGGSYPDYKAGSSYVPGAKTSDVDFAHTKAGHATDFTLDGAAVHAANVELVATAPPFYHELLIKLMSTITAMPTRPTVHFTSLVGTELRYQVLYGDHTRVAAAMRSLGFVVQPGVVQLPPVPADADATAGDATEGESSAAADPTSTDSTPTDTTSADTTSADTTSADTTSADTTSADTTSADTTSTDSTSTDTTSADTTSADTTSTTNVEGATNVRTAGALGSDEPTVDLGETNPREFLNYATSDVTTAKRHAHVNAKSKEGTAARNEHQLMRLAEAPRAVIRSFVAALESAGTRLALHDAALGGRSVFYRVLSGNAATVRAAGTSVGVSVSDTVIRAPLAPADADGGDTQENVPATGAGIDADTLPDNAAAATKEAKEDVAAEVAAAEAAADASDNKPTTEGDSADAALSADEADALRQSNAAMVSELDESARGPLTATLNNLGPHAVVVRLSDATKGGKLVSYELVSGSRQVLEAVAEANGVTATDTTLQSKDAVVVTAVDVTAEATATAPTSGVVTAVAVDERGNPVVDAAPGADGRQTCSVWALQSECPGTTVRLTSSDAIACESDAECAAACCGAVEAPPMTDAEKEAAVVEAHRQRNKPLRTNEVEPPPTNGLFWDPRAHLLTGRG